VEGLAGEHDPAGERDLLAAQAVGVAATVVSLVAGAQLVSSNDAGLDLVPAPVRRSIAPMSDIASTPGALRLFGLSIVARVPLTMLSIGLLIHAQHLTGSFAAAGIAAGAYAVAVGVGGPVLGQLVDRRGQTATLLASSAASAALLGAAALLPAGAPLLALVGLAAAIGLATPPLGACLRTLLPGLLPDADAVRAAYAVEATASELTWVSGPPLALGLGALWSTGGALLFAGAVLLVGTAAFAAQPASRAWQPGRGAPRTRGRSMRAPAMRTLVIVLVAVGALFGAVEVAVAAAADGLGSAAAAGPLLGIWGAGSLLGGCWRSAWAAGRTVPPASRSCWPG